MHYPDLNPLCLFKLHDNYPETGGVYDALNQHFGAQRTIGHKLSVV